MALRSPRDAARRTRLRPDRLVADPRSHRRVPRGLLDEDRQAAPSVATRPRARGRTTVLSGAGLAHRQRTPHEELTVEALDRLLGRGAIGVLDEGEATGSPGLAIERTHDLGRRTDLRKVGPQIVFRGLIRQVADEQSH